jgi:5-bromo-4-chloroindolyl phosphate hydrolysis protein
VEFVFNYLSCSLHYWVELIEKNAPQPDKLSRKDLQYIKDELNNSDEKTIRRWSTFFN